MKWLAKGSAVALVAAVLAAQPVEEERVAVTSAGGKTVQVTFRRPRAEAGRRFPAIVAVSPWGNTVGALRGMGVREPDELVRSGIAVATFTYPGQENDPSPGTFADKYGPERQTNVRDVIRHVVARADVDRANVGVVSFSSGNILVAGALTRSPGDPAVKFWIDGEGPTTRHVLLLNIPGTMAAVPPFPDEAHQGDWMAREFLSASLNDEEYWKEREAFRLMRGLRCRFLRLQGEEDHVHHWYYGHAIHALNTALAGGAPWVRGGDGPVNVRHADASTLGLLPGRIGAQGARVAGYIREMIGQPPPRPQPKNPLLISLVVHVEEGKQVSAERYRQLAAGLRALAGVFRKYDARINLDVEPGFVTAGLQAGDGLLAELERDYKFAIGAFPHGMPSKETLELIRRSGAKPVYLFGHWGRENKDWVADAVDNGIDVMLCFFSILSPDVTPGSIFDHETIPWNRADRVHPWRIGSTGTFLKHDPAGKVIYIPGDSIDELEKLEERRVTGLWNRPLDRIQPPPSLDERDFAVASDYLRRQLVFADPARINTWYIAVNSKKVRDLAANAGLFGRWLESVDREFVRGGRARWASAAEVRQAYLDWEKGNDKR
jgi:hypothetical protein